jgi:hypothetical protein
MCWLVDLGLFLVITYNHVKVLRLYYLIGSSRSKIPAHELPPISLEPLYENLLVLKPCALNLLLNKNTPQIFVDEHPILLLQKRNCEVYEVLTLTLHFINNIILENILQ